MKLKAFLICLISLSLVSYLFYSMDFGLSDISKKIIKIENNDDNPDQKTEKKDVKGIKKVSDKIGEVVKTIKNINKKIVNKNENEQKKDIEGERKIKRNIFKYRELKKEIKIVKKDEGKLSKEDLNVDIKKKYKVNLILKSAFDSLALINRKKYRVDDYLEEKIKKYKILKILSEQVIIQDGTREVNLELKR